MDPEMIPEQNLDEDILQCRAEIQRALGQDPVEEKTGSSEPKEHPAEQSDTAGSENRSEHTEVLTEEPTSGQEEELIEDLIQEDESSNSDSFENLDFTTEESPEEKISLEEKIPEPVPPAPEPQEKDKEKQTPVFPKDLHNYNRILKTLKLQKENLSQTCKDQEQHITDLSGQIEQIRQQHQQAEQKVVDLTAQVKQLSDFQEISEQLRKERDDALSASEQLRRELGDLQVQHQQTLKEKNDLADSLLQKTAEFDAILSDLNKTKTTLKEQTGKSQFLEQEIRKLEQLAEQQKAQLDQLQPMEAQHEIQNQELHLLREKNEDSINTIARLKQEIEQLRMDKTSLHQQVRSLEEGLSRQQMDTQKTIAALKEELTEKLEQIKHWHTEHDRLAEQLAVLQAQMESPEQTHDEQRQPPPEPVPLCLYETDLETEQELASQYISDQAEAPLPRFDLTDQILSQQRQQNSGRRQPPSLGRISPTKNVRKVVQEFLTPTPELRDHRGPARASFPRTPSPDQEFHRPVRRSGGDHQPLIAEIVQRDIEHFCRQNQWIFIEFPSG